VNPAVTDIPIVIAALGDSITAGIPGWSPDPAERAQRGATDPQSQWEYWAAQVDPRLQFRNFGIGGQQTDEIADRLESCVFGADVLIVQGGINNIVHGLEPETAEADLRRMVRRGKELGLRVALADVLPWNNGPPEAEAKIRRLNEMIVAIGRDEDVPVFPFHDTLEDPDHPGRMREEWTAEGNHPSVAGHRRLGELAFKLP